MGRHPDRPFAIADTCLTSAPPCFMDRTPVAAMDRTSGMRQEGAPAWTRAAGMSEAVRRAGIHPFVIPAKAGIQAGGVGVSGRRLFLTD